MKAISYTQLRILLVFILARDRYIEMVKMRFSSYNICAYQINPLSLQIEIFTTNHYANKTSYRGFDIICISVD